jgi:hypothetical protein
MALARPIIEGKGLFLRIPFLISFPIFELVWWFELLGVSGVGGLCFVFSGKLFEQFSTAEGCLLLVLLLVLTTC